MKREVGNEESFRYTIHQ